MGFYDDLATIALDVASDKSIGDVRSWTVVRPSGTGIGSDVTLASEGSKTAYVIPARAPFTTQSAPAWPVWTNDYLVFGAAAMDIRAGDILTDGSLAFLIAGQPDTHFALLWAPADATAVPDLTGAILFRPLRVGTRIGAF